MAVTLKRISLNIKIPSCHKRVRPGALGLNYLTHTIIHKRHRYRTIRAGAHRTASTGIRQPAGDLRSCTEQEAPHPRRGLQPRRRGCGEQSPPLWNWMADTSGPGSYTPPPNANFKGRIQTPNRSHLSLSSAVRIPKDTKEPLGGLNLKTSRPKRPQAPASLQPVGLHRFDRRYRAVHHGVSAAALRARRLRPRPVPVPEQGLRLSRLRWRPPLSPPPSAPPSRPQARLPIYAAPFLTTTRPWARASPAALPPPRGLRSRVAAAVLLPAGRTAPGSRAGAPLRVPIPGAPQSHPGPPAPYLKRSPQQGSHDCHMSANNNKLSGRSPPRAPNRSPRPGLRRHPML